MLRKWMKSRLISAMMLQIADSCDGPDGTWFNQRKGFAFFLIPR
jgi:hypothetical protein